MFNAAFAYTARSAKHTGVDREWSHDDRRWRRARHAHPSANTPNAFYHVTLRGNRQQPIFHDVLDRDCWQRLLSEALVRYGARLHLYCWMTNHIHMVLESGVTPIYKALHLVAGGYARTHQSRSTPQVGHLFQDRYGSRLVDSDAYLLQLIRYIHLNPVTGGIVRDPIEYRWSSHRSVRYWRMKWTGRRGAILLSLFEAHLSRDAGWPSPCRASETQDSR